MIKIVQKRIGNADSLPHREHQIYEHTHLICKLCFIVDQAYNIIKRQCIHKSWTIF